MQGQKKQHDIVLSCCRDFLITKKWRLAFLAFDDIFLSIMAKNISFFIKEKQLPEFQALEAAYFSALNYYFDRPDVAEEAKDQILLFEDYHNIVSAGFRELSCYEDKRYLQIAKERFTDEQLRMLGLGIAAGVDISFYENPLFSISQMYEILLGLVQGLDSVFIAEYANPSYADYVMRFCRKCLIK